MRPTDRQPLANALRVGDRLYQFGIATESTNRFSAIPFPDENGPVDEILVGLAKLVLEPDEQLVEMRLDGRASFMEQPVAVLDGPAGRCTVRILSDPHRERTEGVVVVEPGVVRRGVAGDVGDVAQVECATTEAATALAERLRSWESEPG